MSGWDLSCPDWEERLRTGRSLVPDLPLIDAFSAARAVAVFDKLRLADVPGTPTMGEAGGEWFREIVRALFGSLNPATRERMIRELLLLVPKKNSKALALDTPIATPTGFTTMAAVGVGDLVIDSNGQPAPVLAKSEVFVGHDCYEIEFSTGECVTCDAEHLWVTDSHRDRERNYSDRKAPRPSAKPAREIAESLTTKSGTFTINNHRTALALPLALPHADLPIPPYVLGAWLGDGSTEGAVITAGADDADEMVCNLRAAGHDANIKGFSSSGAARISIAQAPGNGPLPYRFRTAAIRLGVFGCKHIPTIYLRASFDQRAELLRGLMDTDGTISLAGQASFSTTTRALRDDVVELVNSLGFKASASESRAMLYDKDCGLVWNVQFWPFATLPVFTMARKLARQRASAAKNAARSRSRQIVACRAVESVPTQCISVGSATRQFLVSRSLIPTHNTTNGALLMLTALLLNERPNASLILTAPVQDVAQLAFDAVAGAIELDPVLKQVLHVRDHLKTIEHRTTKAELQIMSFDPAALTGQKPVAVLVDELHVIAKMGKAASAIRQLRGGMLPFPEAFLAFITTQSEEPPSGVFGAELEKARAIRDGKQAGAMLPVLYEFPEAIQKDQELWRNPDCWPMVTPNAGRSISIPRLIEEMRTAENTSQDELIAWASQHLNLQIGLSLHGGRWSGADFWLDAARPDLVPSLAGLLERCEVAVVGIDGGGLDDLLGLAVLGRERETRRWLLWAHAWAHPIVLQRRTDISALLRDFVSDGDLTLVEKVGQDVEEVADLCLQVRESGLLPDENAIGVDAVGIGDIVDALHAPARNFEDKQIVAISQGWKLNAAIKTAERKVAGQEMVHGGSRLMAWCVGNARVTMVGNAVSVTKQRSGSAKIDPLMATFDAISLMALNPAARKSGLSFFFV